MHGHFYGNFTGNLAHAQSVCTRPFSRGEGPGDEATFYTDIRYNNFCVWALAYKICNYILNLQTNLRRCIYFKSVFIGYEYKEVSFGQRVTQCF